MSSSMSFTAGILGVSLLTLGFGAPAAAIGSTNSTASASGGPLGIRIGRDQHGVAHVLAKSDAGAYFGAGYAAAEDRLFQMCWMRIVARGRAAEFFGPGAVVNPLTGAVKKTHVLSDRKARTLGWSKHAARVVASMSPSTLALLQAYSDGVNALMQDPNYIVDPLFDQHSVPLEPWTPEDCVLAWTRLAEFFGTNGLEEARFLHDLQALQSNPALSHHELLDELTGAHVCDDSASVIQRADVAPKTQDAMFEYAAAHQLEQGYGCLPYAPSPHFSQAWAVAGSRITTGNSVLVGDPRIGVTLPSQLYEWSMRGASFEVRGVGVPGCPNILSGSSKRIAWSPTALGLDQADLLLLKTDPVGHPGQYQLDGQWVNFTAPSLETIHVLGESDQYVMYRESYWGPVVTGVVQDVHAGEEYAVRRVPFYDPTADPAQGFANIYRSSTVEGFFDALAGWTWPSVNLVFADSSGRIGYSIAGTVVVRNPKLPFAGIVAQDGSLTSSDWIDILPHSLKPHVFDPAAGYVYSANHRPIGTWYPIPVRFGSGGSGDTFRSRRLRELLTQAPATLPPEKVLDPHHDVVSVAGRDFTKIGLFLKAQVPCPLSTDGKRSLVELGPWLSAGARMDNSHRGTLIVANLDLGFRVQHAGAEMISQYGGGECGLNLFLKQALAKIQAVPPVALTTAEIAYVDKVLSDALRLTMTVGPTALWQGWYQQNALTVQLPHWTSLEGFPSLAPLQSAQVGPFRAVDTNTLLSPLSQSYTQVVELGVGGSQFSIAPPGVVEPIGAHDDDQVNLWETEQLKFSPVSVLDLRNAGILVWKDL